MYQLDTDILIDIQRGHTPAIALPKTLLERGDLSACGSFEGDKSSQGRSLVDTVGRDSIKVPII